MYPDENRDPAFGQPSAVGLPVAVLPVRIQNLTTNETLLGGAMRFFGFSLWETTGTAVARMRLWSKATTGDLISIIQLNASESRSDYFFPHGIAVHTLFKEQVTGSIDGVVYVLPE